MDKHNFNKNNFLLLDISGSLDRDLLNRFSFEVVKDLKWFDHVSGFFFNIKQITKSELQNFLIFYGFDISMLTNEVFNKNLIFFFSLFYNEAFILYFMEIVLASEIFFLFSNKLLSKSHIISIMYLFNKRIYSEVVRFFLSFGDVYKHISYKYFKKFILSSAFFFDSEKKMYHYSYFLNMNLRGDSIDYLTDYLGVLLDNIFLERLTFLDVVSYLIDMLIYNLTDYIFHFENLVFTSRMYQSENNFLKSLVFHNSGLFYLYDDLNLELKQDLNSENKVLGGSLEFVYEEYMREHVKMQQNYFPVEVEGNVDFNSIRNNLRLSDSLYVYLDSILKTKNKSNLIKKFLRKNNIDISKNFTSNVSNLGTFNDFLGVLNLYIYFLHELFSFFRFYFFILYKFKLIKFSLRYKLKILKVMRIDFFNFINYYTLLLSKYNFDGFLKSVTYLFYNKMRFFFYKFFLVENLNKSILFVFSFNFLLLRFVNLIKINFIFSRIYFDIDTIFIKFSSNFFNKLKYMADFALLDFYNDFFSFKKIMKFNFVFNTMFFKKLNFSFSLKKRLFFLLNIKPALGLNFLFNHFYDKFNMNFSFFFSVFSKRFYYNYKSSFTDLILITPATYINNVFNLLNFSNIDFISFFSTLSNLKIYNVYLYYFSNILTTIKFNFLPFFFKIQMEIENFYVLVSSEFLHEVEPELVDNPIKDVLLNLNYFDDSDGVQYELGEDHQYMDEDFELGDVFEYDDFEPSFFDEEMLSLNLYIYESFYTKYTIWDEFIIDVPKSIVNWDYDFVESRFSPLVDRRFYNYGEKESIQLYGIDGTVWYNWLYGALLADLETMSLNFYKTNPSRFLNAGNTINNDYFSYYFHLNNLFDLFANKLGKVRSVRNKTVENYKTYVEDKNLVILNEVLNNKNLTDKQLNDLILARIKEYYNIDIKNIFDLDFYLYKPDDYIIDYTDIILTDEKLHFEINNAGDFSKVTEYKPNRQIFEQMFNVELKDQADIFGSNTSISMSSEVQDEASEHEQDGLLSDAFMLPSKAESLGRYYEESLYQAPFEVTDQHSFNISDEMLLSEYSSFNYYINTLVMSENRAFFGSWLHDSPTIINTLHFTMYNNNHHESIFGDPDLGFDTCIRDLVSLHEKWVWWDLTGGIYKSKEMDKNVGNLLRPRNIDELFFLNTYILSGTYPVLNKIFRGSAYHEKAERLKAIDCIINEFYYKGFKKYADNRNSDVIYKFSDNAWVKNFDEYYNNWLHTYNSFLFYNDYAELVESVYIYNNYIEFISKYVKDSKNNMTDRPFINNVVNFFKYNNHFNEKYLNPKLFNYLLRVEKSFDILRLNSLRSFIGSFYNTYNKDKLVIFWEHFFLSILETLNSYSDLDSESDNYKEDSMFFEDIAEVTDYNEFNELSAYWSTPRFKFKTLFEGESLRDEGFNDLPFSYIYRSSDFDVVKEDINYVSLPILIEENLKFLGDPNYLVHNDGLGVNFTFQEVIFFDLYETYMDYYSSSDSEGFDVSELTRQKYFELDGFNRWDFDLSFEHENDEFYGDDDDLEVQEKVSSYNIEYPFTLDFENEAYQAVDFNGYYLSESSINYLNRYYSLTHLNISLYGFLNNYFIKTGFNKIMKNINKFIYLNINNFIIDTNVFMNNKLLFNLELYYFYNISFYKKLYNKFILKKNSRLLILLDLYFYVIFFFKNLKLSVLQKYFFFFFFASLFFYLLVKLLMFKLKFQKEHEKQKKSDFKFILFQIIYSLSDTEFLTFSKKMRYFLLEFIFAFLQTLLYFHSKRLFICKYGKLFFFFKKNNLSTYFFKFMFGVMNLSLDDCIDFRKYVENVSFRSYLSTLSLYMFHDKKFKLIRDEFLFNYFFGSDLIEKSMNLLPNNKIDKFSKENYSAYYYMNILNMNFNLDTVIGLNQLNDISVVDNYIIDAYEMFKVTEYRDFNDNDINESTEVNLEFDESTSDDWTSSNLESEVSYEAFNDDEDFELQDNHQDDPFGPPVDDFFSSNYTLYEEFVEDVKNDHNQYLDRSLYNDVDIRYELDLDKSLKILNIYSPYDFELVETIFNSKMPYSSKFTYYYGTVLYFFELKMRQLILSLFSFYQQNVPLKDMFNYRDIYVSTGVYSKFFHQPLWRHLAFGPGGDYWSDILEHSNFLSFVHHRKEHFNMYFPLISRGRSSTMNLLLEKENRIVGTSWDNLVPKYVYTTQLSDILEYFIDFNNFEIEEYNMSYDPSFIYRGGADFSKWEESFVYGAYFIKLLKYISLNILYVNIYQYIDSKYLKLLYYSNFFFDLNLYFFAFTFKLKNKFNLVVNMFIKYIFNMIYMFFYKQLCLFKNFYDSILQKNYIILSEEEKSFFSFLSLFQTRIIPFYMYNYKFVVKKLFLLKTVYRNKLSLYSYYLLVKLLEWFLTYYPFFEKTLFLNFFDLVKNRLIKYEFLLLNNSYHLALIYSKYGLIESYNYFEQLRLTNDFNDKLKVYMVSMKFYEFFIFLCEFFIFILISLIILLFLLELKIPSIFFTYTWRFFGHYPAGRLGDGARNSPRLYGWSSHTYDNKLNYFEKERLYDIWGMF